MNYFLWLAVALSFDVVEQSWMSDCTILCPFRGYKSGVERGPLDQSWGRLERRTCESVCPAVSFAERLLVRGND